MAYRPTVMSVTRMGAHPTMERIGGESMPTKHPLIFFTKEKFIPIERLQINLNKLEDALLNNDQSKSIKILKNLVNDWNSDNY